jgi:hypothetical protein
VKTIYTVRWTDYPIGGKRTLMLQDFTIKRAAIRFARKLVRDGLKVVPYSGPMSAMVFDSEGELVASVVSTYRMRRNDYHAVTTVHAKE